MIAGLYPSGTGRDSAPMPLAALLLLQVAAAPPAVEEAEVVVTARRRKCEIAVADRIVRDREFRARAAEWAAGVPVRVVVRDGASYKCLAKIVFRLNEYGVVRVTFDPPGPF